VASAANGIKRGVNSDYDHRAIDISASVTRHLVVFSAAAATDLYIYIFSWCCMYSLLMADWLASLAKKLK
jgi:hypothetical protein